MTWALPVRGGYVTSGFGPRPSPGGVGSTAHRGLDIGGRGTDWLVRSVGPGVVHARGTNTIRGLWIVVRHDDGTTTTYQHLSSVTASGRVLGGTVLGVMGMTGTSTARHLHLEAFPAGRFALNGTAWITTDRAVDPEPYLRARGVDVRTGTVTTGSGGSTGGDVPTVPSIPPIPGIDEEDDDMTPDQAAKLDAVAAAVQLLVDQESQYRGVPQGVQGLVVEVGRRHAAYTATGPDGQHWLIDGVLKRPISEHHRDVLSTLAPPAQVPYLGGIPSDALGAFADIGGAARPVVQP
jgi:hypothetical protein